MNLTPPADLETVVRRLTDLARDLRRGEWYRLLRLPANRPLAARLAERLEALADAAAQQADYPLACELYSVALAAPFDQPDSPRLRGKLLRATLAAIDAKLAAPPLDADAPAPDGWDHGWDRAESLALAGKFAEADLLLLQLDSVRDDYPARGFELPSRFESIGDHLLPSHPEIARWFYEKFRDASDALPADTAVEGARRDAIVQSAAAKMAQAESRLPRRLAAIDLVLTGRGQGPAPAPQHSTAAVENQQLLKLIPPGALSYLRYYFRVRIEGAELRLFQVQDEFGRTSPFALEGQPSSGAPAPPAIFRLVRGQPATIFYPAPGGGPVWTLTLTGITCP